MEYASGGELFEYILARKYLKETESCKYFVQLICAVRYLHSKGIVHRDLKLENLLLDGKRNIIITDFGFANKFDGENHLLNTSCGSPCYAAPELVINDVIILYIRVMLEKKQIFGVVVSFFMQCYAAIYLSKIRIPTNSIRKLWLGNIKPLKYSLQIQKRS